MKSKFSLFLIFLFWNSFSYRLNPYELNRFNKIEDLTKKCLSSHSYVDCAKAMTLLKNLKLKAEKSNNYPCQTRLLGLEANLIMSINNVAKKNKTHQIMKQVKRFC